MKGEMLEADLEGKLDYSLWRRGRAVEFTIMSMDERFRRKKGWGHSVYVAKNGIRVVGNYRPALYDGEVHLRGLAGNEDFITAKLTFHTVEKADAYCRKIADALNEWAENWEGWEGDSIERETNEEEKDLYHLVSIRKNLNDKIEYTLDFSDEGRTLKFKILAMDERFRECADYESSNGFRVSSIACPYLCCDQVGVRGGNKGSDGVEAMAKFSTAEECGAYAKKVIEALADWAENWPGWKEEKEEKVVERKEKIVYRLVPIHRGAVFQVEYLSKEFNGLFNAKNGIGLNQIHVCNDTHADTLYFNSNDERDEYMMKVNGALKELADNLHRWEKQDKAGSDSDDRCVRHVLGDMITYDIVKMEKGIAFQILKLSKYNTIPMLAYLKHVLGDGNLGFGNINFSTMTFGTNEERDKFITKINVGLKELFDRDGPLEGKEDPYRHVY